MNYLHSFQAFGRHGLSGALKQHLKAAVVYTRVSSKEQAQNNLSLDFQLKHIQQYASRNGFTIIEQFGGTFESAKTDGRKEFQRMLSFVENHTDKVSHILVYTVDRFSRSGGAAIQLAEELRRKYGVSVLAVTQPTDDSNPSGVFQQNIQLLFSEFDNQLRRQRTMAGMKEKFERGIWCIRPPFGYSILRENGVKSIVLNKQGQLLKQAFVWKASGMKNQEILEKLNQAGLYLYKQKLSAIFKNPFYAGMVATKMLDGRVVEGTHEKLISPDLFLKIHQLKNGTRRHYEIIQREDNRDMSLKVFMRCGDCGEPFTGYRVKGKEKCYAYYKCRGENCRGNFPVMNINDSFLALLQRIVIKEKYIADLQQILKRNSPRSASLFEIPSIGSIWENGDHAIREKLQWLLFPQGLQYHKETGIQPCVTDPLFTFYDREIN
ncbi:MAG TPA: recombinase family protein [Sediminibacterium sp.]|nr:recombinase family protein [Sediminibacterium sp.]